MSVDRSLRSAFAAILLVAALFIAMNRIVASAPVADWFLPLALFIVGAALLPNWNLSRSRSDVEADETLSRRRRPYLSHRGAAGSAPAHHDHSPRPGNFGAGRHDHRRHRRQRSAFYRDGSRPRHHADPAARRPDDACARTERDLAQRSRRAG